jgi:hypothetical protein
MKTREIEKYEFSRERERVKGIPNRRARRDIRPLARFQLRFLATIDGSRGQGSSLSLFLSFGGEHREGAE